MNSTLARASAVVTLLAASLALSACAGPSAEDQAEQTARDFLQASIDRQGDKAAELECDGASVVSVLSEVTIEEWDVSDTESLDGGAYKVTIDGSNGDENGTIIFTVAAQGDGYCVERID